jgi:hypothetical protein
MNKDEVLKYAGQKVMLILKNNYKFTAVIPFFKNDSFTIKDKFGKEVSISCDYIVMIYEKEEGEL